MLTFPFVSLFLSILEDVIFRTSQHNNVNGGGQGKGD